MMEPLSLAQLEMGSGPDQLRVRVRADALAGLARLALSALPFAARH